MLCFSGWAGCMCLEYHETRRRNSSTAIHSPRSRVMCAKCWRMMRQTSSTVGGGGAMPVVR